MDGDDAATDDGTANGRTPLIGLTSTCCVTVAGGVAFSPLGSESPFFACEAYVGMPNGGGTA